MFQKARSVDLKKQFQEYFFNLDLLLILNTLHSSYIASYLEIRSSEYVFYFYDVKNMIFQTLNDKMEYFSAVKSSYKHGTCIRW